MAVIDSCICEYPTVYGILRVLGRSGLSIILADPGCMAAENVVGLSMVSEIGKLGFSRSESVLRCGLLSN
jgi:hypothetical protein